MDRSYRVVVVGAGGIGAAACYWAARAGVDGAASAAAGARTMAVHASTAAALQMGTEDPLGRRVVAAGTRLRWSAQSVPVPGERQGVRHLAAPDVRSLGNLGGALAVASRGCGAP